MSVNSKALIGISAVRPRFTDGKTEAYKAREGQSPDSQLLLPCLWCPILTAHTGITWPKSSTPAWVAVGAAMTFGTSSFLDWGDSALPLTLM